MNGLVEVIKDELNKLKKMLTQTGTDYIATVTSVEGQTAHVRIAGSDISDTPVAMSINAKAGDTVRVRVSGGKAWITGNDTLPPSNESKEVSAKMLKDMSDREEDITIDFGKMRFVGNTLVVDSNNFKLDEKGNAKYSGKLEAAGGTFNGDMIIESYDPYSLPHTIITEIGQISRLGATLRVRTPWPETIDDPYFYTAITPFELYVDNNQHGYTYYSYDGPHISSDKSLKRDIENIDPVLAKKIRPVCYRLKKDEKIHHGFIAQEIQEILPDAVAAGRDGLLALNYTELIAPLYALVQDQEKRITQLEERLKALEEKL